MSNPVRSNRYFVVACYIFLGVTAVAFTSVPVVYDTLHVRDTLFLTEIGWRVYNGLEPALDFRHLYGGVTAEYISVAFRLFGVKIKALEYAVLLQALTIAGLAAALAYRRLTFLSFTVLLTLGLSLMFARAPLEEVTYFSEPISAHSFIYNRFGTAIMLCVAMFLLVPSRTQWVDDVAAFLCGVLCIVLLLNKPTFFLPILACLICLLVQMRWRDCAIWLAGLGLGILALDFGGARILGSFAYSVAVQGDANVDIAAQLRKAVRIGSAHLLPLMLALVVIGGLFLRGTSRDRRVAASALVILALYSGTTVSFGPAGLVGQQALPMIAGVCLGLYAYGQRTGALALPRLARTSALVLAAYLALPQMANTLISSAIAFRNAERTVLPEGSMQAYLGRSRGYPEASGDAEARAARVARHVASRPDMTAGPAYDLLVDGVQLLRQIDRAGQYGIASVGSGIVFSFAMQSPPIADFPVWPHLYAPEFQPGQTLSGEVDILLISRLTDTELGAVLRQKMGADFSLCRQSGLWQLYTRTASGITGCAD